MREVQAILMIKDLCRTAIGQAADRAAASIYLLIRHAK
jgi:hypothetical protein